MNLFSSSERRNFFFSSLLKPFVSVLYLRLRDTYSSTVQIYLAGLPPTTTFEGIDFVTTLPPAINTLSPIVTPGIINELDPM